MTNIVQGKRSKFWSGPSATSILVYASSPGLPEPYMLKIAISTKMSCADGYVNFESWLENCISAICKQEEPRLACTYLVLSVHLFNNDYTRVI